VNGEKITLISIPAEQLLFLEHSSLRSAYVSIGSLEQDAADKPPGPLLNLERVEEIGIAGNFS
jgi:hypothetical protein